MSLLLAALPLTTAVALRSRWWPASAADDVLTHTVAPGNLLITVTERGNLESQKTVDGICEMQGYENKIIFIVEEGTQVRKGESVVRFDSSEIDKLIAQQEITVNQAKGKVETTRQEVEIARNTGESEVAAAQLELDLATLDLEKYHKGDYEVSLQDLNGKIALAEFELSKAKDAYENFKTLVKKGFREPEQLRGFEESVKSAEYSLARDERALVVLKEYDHKRKLREYEAKAEEAGRKLVRSRANMTANVTKANGEYEAAQATLTLENDRLKEYQDQKTKCEIVAQQDGVLAYANEDWYDSDRRIREGAVVHQRQKIFSLPDMSLLQVKVNVHESVVKKVKAGQKATIRVDAFPGMTFAGTIKSVSQLADSSQSWRRGGVKEYTTIVVLDQTPTVPIKPGMTAEVEILVDRLRDVLAVPVQAVTEHRRTHYVYVKDVKGTLTRRAVKVGQSNERMVEVQSGLQAGVLVAMDARDRALEDFAGDGKDGPDPDPNASPDESSASSSDPVAETPTDVSSQATPPTTPATAEPAGVAQPGTSSPAVTVPAVTVPVAPAVPPGPAETAPAESTNTEGATALPVPVEKGATESVQTEPAATEPTSSTSTPSSSNTEAGFSASP